MGSYGCWNRERSKPHLACQALHKHSTPAGVVVNLASIALHFIQGYWWFYPGRRAGLRDNRKSCSDPAQNGFGKIQSITGLQYRAVDILFLPTTKLTNGKLKKGLKIQLFCFLFHYALQIHGRFEECELGSVDIIFVMFILCLEEGFFYL